MPDQIEVRCYGPNDKGESVLKFTEVYSMEDKSLNLMEVIEDHLSSEYINSVGLRRIRGEQNA